MEAASVSGIRCDTSRAQRKPLGWTKPKVWCPFCAMVQRVNQNTKANTLLKVVVVDTLSKLVTLLKICWNYLWYLKGSYMRQIPDVCNFHTEGTVRIIVDCSLSASLKICQKCTFAHSLMKNIQIKQSQLDGVCNEEKVGACKSWILHCTFILALLM